MLAKFGKGVLECELVVGIGVRESATVYDELAEMKIGQGDSEAKSL